VERQTAKRISQGILLAGVVAAASVYFTARERAGSALGYDPLAEKKYLRQMERLGGKANVLSAEFQDWFDGLWHGRRLAVTLLVLSAVGAGGFWYVVTLPPLEEPGPRPGPKPDGG
jgi:hypothetical protein